MFTIASWNVNSLKVRHEHVLNWLRENQPDILAVQETKTQDQNFPSEEFLAEGWHTVYAGQKTFNGVAIFSQDPVTEIATEIPGFEDPQRRVLGVEVGNCFVLNLYVPNGQSVGSEKYEYKMSWLTALINYVKELLNRYEHVILLGDFNIAPADIDVHDPAAWEGHVLVSPQEREKWQTLLDCGLTDTFRIKDDSQTFSWWDYRQGGFRRNHGVRIDHILISQNLVPLLDRCWIDKEPRTLEKPSDHTPIVATFDIDL